MPFPSKELGGLDLDQGCGAEEGEGNSSSENHICGQNCCRLLLAPAGTKSKDIYEPILCTSLGSKHSRERGILIEKIGYVLNHIPKHFEKFR